MVSVPGGAIGKVVRWSFEKQGLYQPTGAPTPVTTPGAPPDVDVYINDGFYGEYGYLEDFWDNTNIWNLLAPDPSTTPVDHQTPMCGARGFYQPANLQLSKECLVFMVEPALARALFNTSRFSQSSDHGRIVRLKYHCLAQRVVVAACGHN
jgi:hypothetical protein